MIICILTYYYIRVSRVCCFDKFIKYYKTLVYHIFRLCISSLYRHINKLFIHKASNINWI